MKNSPGRRVVLQDQCSLYHAVLTVGTNSLESAPELKGQVQMSYTKRISPHGEQQALPQY